MIGHASQDENCKLKNGKAGDQTGKEVCVRNWFNRPWNVILICKDPVMREKIAAAMQAACENNLIGYDQNQRNSLLTYSRPVGYNPALVNTKCECDCSSLVSICCMYAGISESVLFKSNNCCTTSTLRKALVGTGLFEEHVESKYINSEDYLPRGAILLYECHHVAVCLTNGKYATNNSTCEKIDMVDVSHHNTITDWNKLNSECKNVCIRMGYISYQSGTLTTDKKFIENIKNANTKGIPVGVYCWDQSLNTNEAVALADYCIKAIKPYKISLPVFIDSEYYNSKREGRADNISKSQRTQNIIAFCERIKSAGYVPGVYASDSWFKTNLEFDKIKDYVIWCAKYSTNKPTISKYDIWQNGSKNYSWATGAIDTNIIYNLNPNTINNTENITPIFVHGEEKYISSKCDKYLKAEIVSCSHLNVRSSPSSVSDDNILTSVKAGTISTVIEHVNGWYQLLFDDGISGWCSDKYIKLK